MTTAEKLTAFTASSVSSPRSQNSRVHRACTNCAKVKEKCVLLEDANITKCQRCQRLRKYCIVPEPPKKRQRTRTDDAISSPYPTPAASASASEVTAVLPFWYGANNFDRDGRPVSASLAELPTEKKAILFDDFVADLNPYFPFLVLEDKDAGSCEKNAPFTFTACLAASLHRQPALQRRVSREMLGYIGEAMFLGGRKSMDLIQGLSILLAWYMFHTQRNPQLMNLIFLIKALLLDLGLTVPHSNSTPFAIMADIPQLMHGPGVESDNHGLAGLRALLMSWYINAQIAVAYRRLDYPRWSEYLEDCLQRLQVAKSSPADLQAIQVIRLYHTMERYLGPDGIKPSGNLPIRSYVRCFRDDLQRIRSILPPSSASNQHFELHLKSVEIALYDSVTSAPCDHPAQMLEALHALLARVNAYFDLFLSQPTEAFPLFSFLHMSQVSHATDVLAKLSFFQYEGWDLNYVRGNHNFASFIERTMDKFEEVYFSERTRFPDLDTSRFAIYPIKLRQRKKWYEERVANEAKEALEQAKGAANSGMSGFDISQFSDAFGDQIWWTYDGSFNVQ